LRPRSADVIPKRSSTKVALAFGIIALIGAGARIVGPLMGPESYLGRDFVIFGPMVAMIGGLGLTVSILVRLLKTPNGQPPAIAPGWYPDPHGPGSLRYFDGRSWTEHTAPRRPGI
jgi:hypothetical protein